MGFVLFLLALGFIISLIGSIFTIATNNEVDIDPFMNQLKKLIMVNNIDRAIKLCNRHHEALFPRSAKNLLVRANRPYSLELIYQEERRRLNPPNLKKLLVFTRRAYIASSIILVVCCVTIIMMLQTEGWSRWFSGAVGTGVLITLFVRGIMFNLMVRNITYRSKCENALLKLRNILYSRKDYIPAHIVPRKDTELSEEKLSEWRKSLEKIELTAAENPEVGAEELYNRHADKQTGVLPPL